MNFDPNMLMQFMQFQNSFRGNPQQMVQQMLNSGRVSPQQYQNAVQMVSTIGSRIPLYCSGVGKAMLAVLPAEEAKHLWEESHIERRTSSTITRYDQFERELNRIRKRGYAIDDEENEPGVRCCAAALCREDGRADYAFSISAPINRMSDERIEEVSRLILSTKTEMQKALHWD